jgi:hypothetical protein
METLLIVGIAAVVLLTVAAFSALLVVFAVKYLPHPNHRYNLPARYFRAKQRAHEQFWETLLGDDEKADETSHSK